MDKFDSFLKQLLNKPSKKTTLKVKGTAKRIRAMVRLTSRNYLNEGELYIKIIFEDDSFLLIMPNQKELYYANSIIGHIKTIKDNQIGNDQLIKYKGKEYKLDNKDDYQFVLELIVGSPLEIEGECRFSDYLPVSGSNEFLSLGWLSYTNERSDINPKIIDLQDVQIIKDH